MTDTILLPSLSEDGWITSSISAGDYIFAHFFESDYSQTQIYNGKVSSLAWVIREGQGDIPKTMSLLRTTLQNYFGRYFTSVTVEVNDITDPDYPSKVALKMYVSYTDKENKTIILGKMLELLDSKINKIVTLSNG